MLVNLTMSKAFAWGNQPGEKQKEVMTPSAASSTDHEPKLHPDMAVGFGTNDAPSAREP